MMRRSVLMLSLAAVTLSACHKNAPPVVVQPRAEAPPPPPGVNQDSLRRAQMRQDSIRRAEAAAEAAREGATRARVALEQTVYFDYDQADLRADTKSALDAKLAILRASPSVNMRIEGNTDERGSVEYNLALGMRRATAAKQYLVGFGLDAGRFETVSYGEERPVDMGHDESAWARNRRDDFRITSGADNIRTGS
jgi:peptidoglycan-associated lipoprotein